MNRDTTESDMIASIKKKQAKKQRMQIGCDIVEHNGQYYTKAAYELLLKQQEQQNK
ncbi:MAG: hypothetical protein ACRDFB_04495 [Rhabdochlamydiaceae bacterium]